MTPSSPDPTAEAPLASTAPGIPDDGDEDVNVLTLAGKIPSKDAEWLLITSLDGQPGGEFLARHLGRDELCAHGSDVLVRLVPEGGTPRRPRSAPAVEAAAQAAQVMPAGVSAQGLPVPGTACPATAWPIQSSRAVRRSSRAGSAPAATSIDRTWAKVRPGGSMSSASCVITPRAATAWRVRLTAGSFSQSSMRSGRSTQIMVSRSRSSSGAAAPPGGVKACFSLRSRQQRVHSAVDSCQVCWQDAQRFQKAGSGLRQRAQSGSRSVPPFSGAPVPHCEQVIQRLRHRSHTGVPVAREMPIRPPPADPQMLQGRSGPGRQVWQTGPASVTAATPA